MIRKEHTHLWNDMPSSERDRLMPYMIEAQINQILACRQKAVRAHNRHLKELDDHIRNLEGFLAKECREASKKQAESN